MSTLAKKKAAPVAPDAASKKKQLSLQFSEKSSRTENQERRFIAALRRRPHTTDEFRAALGILQISARIWGLRSKGFQISTTRVTVVDRDGFGRPRAALYSLVSEPEGAGR